MSIETLFSSNIIVPIIVAFIGFLIAVTTAVIAKEQKVSEFRQAWIDGLRNDIAEFTALIYSAVTEKYRLKKITENELHFSMFSEEAADIQLKRLKQMDGILKLSSLIKLRLNHRGKHEVLITNIGNVIKTLNQDNFGYEELESLDLMLNESHQVLNNQWQKVKKGEFLYRGAIKAAKILIFAILTAFLVLIILASYPTFFSIIG
jgi:hypothetical protein